MEKFMDVLVGAAVATLAILFSACCMLALVVLIRLLAAALVGG